jgi:hypothetical protein
MFLSRLLPRPALTPAFLERALQHYRVAKQFRIHLGYTGDFTNPTTYHEKVQFRKLHGNQEFYARVADKYAVREYVSERIGDQYLKPLLGVYTHLTPAILESLPRPFIIKSNNGCRGHRIVREQDRPDWQAIIAHFDALRHGAFGRGSGELHYDRIPFRILIEALLQDSDGGPLWDYDIWCFNTRAGFRHLQSLISPRDDKLSFDENWQLLQGPQPDAAVQARINPPQFPHMLELARALSADFDFVRVDFNIVGGRIYFGEITCTPGQGYTAVTSARRLQLLNDLWELDSLNPRLYRPPRAHRPNRNVLAAKPRCNRQASQAG